MRKVSSWDPSVLFKICLNYFEKDFWAIFRNIYKGEKNCLVKCRKIQLSVTEWSCTEKKVI